MTVYNARISPPESPTSFGRYSLVLDDAQATYTVIVQVLMDSPRERDWRAEFNTVSGHFEREGDRFTFFVSEGRACVRSSAWNGRGVEDYRPFASFAGTLAGEVMTLDYNGTLTLTRSDGPAVANPSLVIPDYALFD
jgi:hypothetical protein